MKALLLFALFPLALVAQESAPKLTLPEMPEPKLGADSMPQDGVPKGTVSEHVWKDSKIFPGTIRSYYIYQPAQYDPQQPTAVMVFQDGHAYVNPNGDFRVPTVFDNLIQKGDIPPIIGIFINPGIVAEELPKEPWKAKNRSVEYDTLSDAYARFLLEEILPEVGKTYNLTNDPDQRAICGMSSGGICAWTVAWERPDAFHKVVSQIGSFTNIRGGDVYPGLIRKTPMKPIRGFFQDGINDLDNAHGSWPLGNLQMQAALKFAGYDFKYVWGHGSHSGKHGGAIFPDTLRWLWRK
ncbi:esterase family protein [Luteolibacter pohnpeiensis]|uniref:Esterase family protein n=1 Tax=Luteolibacter pohnpeiensis TaxID=454153 RepID=A0A934S8Y1_9BACT|nr:alpha/beta hydrolase-fold protein [Luteolibacter pohnpeiensis]MBK1881544.1 esterase family protein [Luteolibacter pohnpeiensis]